MEIIKKTAEYTIYLKANGRHAVKDAKRRWVNGDEKVAILGAEGLVKAPPPPAPEPETATDAEANADADSENAEADGAEDADEAS